MGAQIIGIFGQEVRIASKPEKLVGVKTPKRGLTSARLSSIEISVF
jgi:hypothetical protein